MRLLPPRSLTKIRRRRGVVARSSSPCCWGGPGGGRPEPGVPAHSGCAAERRRRPWTAAAWRVGQPKALGAEWLRIGDPLHRTSAWGLRLLRDGC